MSGGRNRFSTTIDRLLTGGLLVVAIFMPQLAIADTAADGSPIKDKWAVLIGVGKFENPTIPTLKYPAKDAKDLAEFLVKSGNFKRDHILVLTDELATRENILDAFGDGWLPKRVLEDDLVLVYVSSHGSALDNRGNNFIIAHDTDPEKPFATGIKQSLLKDVTERTGCQRVVLMLDACHSGTATSDAKGLTRNGIDPSTYVGTGQVVISSSKPEQVSWESKRYQNGVFTHQLMEALQSKGADTKIEDAYASLKDGVEAEVRFDRTVAQTPLLLSKWQGPPLALLAPPTNPRIVPGEPPPPAPPPRPATPVASAGRALQVPAANAAAGKPNVSAVPVKPTNVVKATVSPPSANAGKFAYLLRRPMMTTDWRSSGGDPTLESGTRLITEDELDGMNQLQVECILNEAFARHGRQFLTRGIQDYFNAQPWYSADPDYHWRADDPQVQARGSDDTRVINPKRTPKQAANIALCKKVRARVMGR